MKIKSVEFIKSSSKLSECPQTGIPEIALIGRSNVGKSTLINALLNRKSLAKISSTPGKTKLINHFGIYTDTNDLPNSIATINSTVKDSSKLLKPGTYINKNTPKFEKLDPHNKGGNHWYLTDLPGYGWAKVSKTEKAKWAKMTKEYLLKREEIYCIFVLVDSRLSPQKIDITFINWLGGNKLPIAIVMTKTDKITSHTLKTNTSKLQTELLKTWDTLPSFFTVSSVKKNGIDKLLDYIGKTIMPCHLEHNIDSI